jgi:spermidine synthase
MHWLIYGCFLISGVTGLVYEVLWGRYFQLFIGASSYAHTVVLATFMGGLALGNALFGRLVDRPVKTLRVYGLLEIGIGAACALFPATYDWLAATYLSLASSDTDSPLNLLLKLLFAVVAMLVPTILMGGTLPVLVRTVIRRMGEVGSKVGTLYFLNSAGAMLGCLIAGFYLIPSFGLELAFILTAIVNIAIGILFLALSRRQESAAPSAEVTAPAPEAKVIPELGRTYGDGQIRGVYALIFLTGALTMIYELVWIRLLGLITGSSTYSFSIMLFTFIGGIALGGLIVSRLLRKERDALLLFALCELGVFLTILIMMPFYQKLPYYFNVLASMLNRSEQTFPLFIGIKIFMCTLAMSLPAILIGMTLPLASRIAVRGLKILGTGVGNVFSINTLGNVLGALLGGFVLIPWLGLQGAMVLGLFFTGAAGIGLLLLARRGSFAQRLIAAAVTAIVFIIAFFASPSWDPALLSIGLFRDKTRFAESYEEYLKKATEFEVIYAKDGADLTVVVTQDPKDTGRRWLKVNGKIDASTGIDMATQLHLGHVPMLLHPGPLKVLVIGLGSGCTANAVLHYEVEHLDIVEISESVVEASRHFQPILPSPLDDTRTELHIADAKEFLALQPAGTYDIIISEPSNPWIAGIGNLFSQEFFATAKSRLKPGGLMVQWVQLYEMHDRIASVIFNTFSSVYPNVTAWHPGTMDLILVGSPGSHAVDYERMGRLLALPEINDELTAQRVREKVRNPLTFLAMQFMGPQAFRSAFPGEGTINSDFFPFLEFEAPRMLFVHEGVKELFMYDGRRRPREGSDLYVAEYLGDKPLTSEQIHELLIYFGTKYTEFDVPIVPAFIDAYDRVAEKGNVAQEFYFQEAMLTFFGRRALWKSRVKRGAMAELDWLKYLDFEAKALTQLTTVFMDPSGEDYLKVLGECLGNFPDHRDALLQTHNKLMTKLGRTDIHLPNLPAP